jgi:hypothetical protein
MRKVLAVVVASLSLPALALGAGQAMSPVVSAKLKGSAEVPKGDPDGRGLVILHLNANKATACWEFKGVAKIGKPTAAHIHKGRKGVAGPVVVPLGTTTYKVQGCRKSTKALIEAIETNPNRYYVNIHNARYPGGAIRGQLVVGMTG